MRYLACLFLCGCDFLFPLAGPVGPAAPAMPPADMALAASDRRVAVPPPRYTWADVTEIGVAPDLTPTLVNPCGQVLVWSGSAWSGDMVVLTPDGMGRYAPGPPFVSLTEMAGLVYDSLEPTAMNSRGQVAGIIHRGEDLQAFFYHHAQPQFIEMADLPIYPLFTTDGETGLVARPPIARDECAGTSLKSAAYAVNDQGQVAGYAQACICDSLDRSRCSAGPNVAMRWDIVADAGSIHLAGVRALAGPVPGALMLDTEAHAVDEEGSAAGWAGPAGTAAPYLFQKDAGMGTPLPLKPLRSARVTHLVHMGAGGGPLALGQFINELGTPGAVAWEGTQGRDELANQFTLLGARADGTVLVGNGAIGMALYFDGAGYLQVGLAQQAGITRTLSVIATDPAGHVLASVAPDGRTYLLTPDPPPPACP